MVRFLVFFFVAGFSVLGRAEFSGSPVGTREPAAVAPELHNRMVQVITSGNGMSGAGWAECGKRVMADIKNAHPLIINCEQYPKDVYCNIHVRIKDAVRTTYLLLAVKMTEVRGALKLDVARCGILND